MIEYSICHHPRCARLVGSSSCRCINLLIPTCMASWAAPSAHMWVSAAAATTDDDAAAAATTQVALDVLREQQAARDKAVGEGTHR